MMNLSKIFKTLVFSMTAMIFISSVSALAGKGEGEGEDFSKLSQEQFTQLLLAMIDYSNFDMEKLERELFAMMDENDEEKVVFSGSSSSSSESEDEIDSMKRLERELFALLDEDENGSSESSSASSESEKAKDDTTSKICEDECAKICSEVTPAPIQISPSIQINIINNVHNTIFINSAASKYKTEICKKWASTGKCAYGNNCQFAHGQGELIKKHPFFKTK